MSKLYATILTDKGAKGSRTAQAYQSIQAAVQSFDGSVIVSLDPIEPGSPALWAMIRVAPGSQADGGRILYHGPLASLLAAPALIPGAKP